MIFHLLIGMIFFLFAAFIICISAKESYRNESHIYESLWTQETIFVHISSYLLLKNSFN